MNLPTRKEVIDNCKNESKLIAAVFPIHYPRELFKAFNIHPMEVWGPPNIDTTLSKSHIQSYICSIVQSALSFYLSGGLDIADIIVVPHCCDSLQGLGSIMRDFVNGKFPIFTPYIPRGKRKEDIEFLANEIKRIYDKLASITGFRPTMDDLLNCVLEEENLDELVLSAYDKHALYMTDTEEFYKLVRSREFIPDSLFSSAIKEFLGKEVRERSKIPLIFSGVLPEPKEIFSVIEEGGAVIIDDDFAVTRRRIYPKGESNDPFIRMAERIVNSPPDSMKGSSIDERANNLKSLTKKRKADGIVFYDIKFCEPEKFYQPMLKNKLKELSVRSMNLEVDINEDFPQQLKTRILAFIETLKRGQ